jgi:uncharacterized membrane protein
MAVVDNSASTSAILALFVSSNNNDYWKANIALIVKCLSIWFIVSYLFGIVFVDALKFENDTHCFINGLNYHEMLIYINHWINNVETKKNDAMRHFIRDIKIIRELSFCHFAHLIS